MSSPATSRAVATWLMAMPEQQASLQWFLVTSGPGAGNTITGIMTAQMDSVPMIIICGQQVTWMLGKDAFQEADIFGITIPVVKHNYLVKDTNSHPPRIIREAHHICNHRSPRPCAC